MLLKFVIHEQHLERFGEHITNQEPVQDFGILITIVDVQNFNRGPEGWWTFAFADGDEVKVPYGDFKEGRVGENNSQPLMRVRVMIDKSKMIDDKESHTFEQIQSKYDSWINHPILEDDSEIHITFDGATHAEQISRNPNPQVRVAFPDRDGPQPLISGCWLSVCRPMVEE